MKRFGFVALGVAGVVGLFVGGMVASVGGATIVPPAPTPTVTVTQTAEPPDPGPTVDEEPTEEPAPATYVPKKSDWEVKVTTRKKQCFGSAGCNVTVKTEPEYVGTRDLPDTGTIEVTYQISGDESGPIVGTFTVTGGQAKYTQEEDLSTRSNGTKIRSKITGVTYSEN